MIAYEEENNLPWFVGARLLTQLGCDDLWLPCHNLLEWVKVLMPTLSTSSNETEKIENLIVIIELAYQMNYIYGFEFYSIPILIIINRNISGSICNYPQYVDHSHGLLRIWNRNGGFKYDARAWQLSWHPTFICIWRGVRYWRYSVLLRFCCG